MTIMVSKETLLLYNINIMYSCSHLLIYILLTHKPYFDPEFIRRVRERKCSFALIKFKPQLPNIRSDLYIWFLWVRVRVYYRKQYEELLSTIRKQEYRPTVAIVSLVYVISISKSIYFHILNKFLSFVVQQIK